MPEQSQRRKAFKLNLSLVLRSLLILDAVFVLILTVGFVVPISPFHDAATRGLPNNFYDDSAKISPFTPPDPEPVRAKTDVVVITARGAHPTFVPPSETADDAPAAVRVDDDHNLRVVPAAVGANARDVQPAVVETVQPAHTS